MPETGMTSEGESMKTLTVTIHRGTNYGALLQAYALQRVQADQGIDNVILDYSDPKHAPKPSLTAPKATLAAVYTTCSRRLHKKAICRRRESFERFHEKHMRLSRFYRTMEELRADAPDVDVLITGSDQVWRFLGNTEFLPARFLDFGAPGVKKISYAASMERLNYTDAQKAQVRRWLSDFAAVSLREESARAYISDIIGKQAKRVLDPVFLPDRSVWDALAVPPTIREPYILCYQVQRCDRMQETVSFLKKTTGYRTIAVLPGSIPYIRTDEARYDVTPEEFLGLYKNAAIVVSGSFHGSAFGLLFGKPTYAVTRAGASSRVREIMQLVHAEPFCIGGEQAIPLPSAFDADAVLAQLRAQREMSLAFLRQNLHNG